MRAAAPAVVEVACALETEALPAYVYDLVGLRDHAASVRAALPEGVELYYTAKANPDPRILAALAPTVDGFEVSSGAELTHVAASAPEHRLAFGGPGKTSHELSRAIAHGNTRIHVESVQELDMLAQLSAAGPDVDVLLRLNPAGSLVTPGVAGLVMAGAPTPFGLDPGEADRAVARLSRGDCPRVRLRGVHLHLASGLDADAALSAADNAVRAARALAARHDLTLHEVVLGGGMSVDYADPEIRFDWARYSRGLRTLLAAHPDLTVGIEPGRALSAYCGWYVTDVLDVKSSHGRSVAVVRGGTHHLRTPAAKGHNQPAAVLPVDQWPHSWPRPEATYPTALVAGQLCTPKDLLSAAVPTPLRAGDRIAFGLAGAYAWNISHHDFLMHPHPSFHYVDTGGGHVGPI